MRVAGDARSPNVALAVDATRRGGSAGVARAGWVAEVGWVALAFLVAMSGPLEGQEAAEHATDPGRVPYIASCARCHGVDGGGGEGPPLSRSYLPRAPDDAALVRLIAAGIPGTGMSGSWWLSRDEQESVAAYVRSLAPSEPEEQAEVPGDPVRGQGLYARFNCDRCHTIGGFGTARGPDLTAVGARRGRDHLRDAILIPGAARPRGQTALPSDFSDYLPVRVGHDSGEEIRGMRMNEDTYTIQIKDGRGRLHSLYKPELQMLEKEFDGSLMQSYRDRLTDSELDDLLSYLLTLQGPRQAGIS